MYRIDKIEDNVRQLLTQSIQRWELLRPGDKLVVAVSGGPDSTALIALLCGLAKEWRLELTLAHLDHGINKELGQAAWLQTKELADKLNVQWVGRREDVLKRKSESGGSVHQLAREKRYGFFVSVAKDVGAFKVATGHTADDQAETVLMRILSGSGSLGASGIPPKRDVGEVSIIRPLLAHRRFDLRAFCNARKLPFIEDPANLELSFLRSRVRHEALPLLEKVFGYDVVPHVAAFADKLREEKEFLDSEVSELLEHEHVHRTPSGLTFPRGLLEDKSRALTKRFVIRAVESISGRTPRLKAVHLDAASDAFSLECPSARVTMPGGLEVSVEGSSVWIGQPVEPSAPLESVVLSCPGSTDIPDLGIRIRVRRCKVPPGPLPAERDKEAYVGLGALRDALVVRGRRPGDTIVPLGSPGRRKLKKALIDRKVPRASRDRLPVIATGSPGDEEILWVVGVVLSEACRIDDKSEEAWRIEVEDIK